MMATQHPAEDVALLVVAPEATESMIAVNNNNNNNNRSTSTSSDSSTEEEDGVVATTSSSKMMLTPSSQHTPPRTSLATDPNLTPIASIKRPRNTTTASAANRRTSLIPPPPPTPASSSFALVDADHTPLSPMHPVRPVHRTGDDGAVVTTTVSTTTTNSSSTVAAQVDVLFSPVVQFLHEHEHAHHHHAHHAHHSSHPTEGGSETADDVAPYYSSEDDDDVSMARLEQLDQDEFNPWQFIQTLPAYETVRHTRPAVQLPPLHNAALKTVVLDLDETLVHCSVQAVSDADFMFPVQFHGEVYQVHVKCRPYLKEFLATISQHFEVIVFTASQKVYADQLLNILDPGMYECCLLS